MEHEAPSNVLKRLLLQEVALLYKRDGRRWKEPIVETLRDLQKSEVQAVFFGGTLRSLLAGRIIDGRPGRPRDVDIVVSGASLEALRERFGEFIARETRFGGLQLRRHDWQLDVWPLGLTWAFVREPDTEPAFAALPSTTFFNMEAIAVEAWPKPGRSREIFSGNDQFFEGILTWTLEINREENPYPDLCVLRTLIMSAEHGFKIGPGLARYVVRHGANMTAEELDDLQMKHYGHMRMRGRTLRTWIESIIETQARDATTPIRLPFARQLQQLQFWPESKEAMHIRVHALSK